MYLYETLRDEPERMTADIFDFLGVDPSFIPDMSVHHNVSGLEPEARPPLCPEVRHRLLRHYRHDILQLQGLIQTDLQAWLS